MIHQPLLPDYTGRTKPAAERTRTNPDGQTKPPPPEPEVKYVSGDASPYILSGEGVHEGLEVEIAPGEDARAVKNILRFEMDDICGTEHRIKVRTQKTGQWKINAECLEVERGATKTVGELTATNPAHNKALRKAYLRFIRGEPPQTKRCQRTEKTDTETAQQPANPPPSPVPTRRRQRHQGSQNGNSGNGAPPKKPQKRRNR